MDGGIRIKKLLSLLLAFFILVSVSSIGTAAEITIQPGTSVIQNAVSNSASGDVIILKPGTYYDNVIVTKPNLTIKSSSGNPGDTTVKARNSRADVFLLQADGIEINGLGISGATATRCSAINLSSCRYCSIENNKLTNNLRGINLLYAHWNTISKNTATSNTEYGIVLGNATSNVISGNTVYTNARGIHIGNSDSNTLISDTVRDNSVYGLYVCGRSDRNTIYDNYFSNTNMTIKNGIGNSYSTTKTAGTNIVGGPYIGGNYWAKPSGTGFSQTAVDKDGDGFSDSAYANIEGSIYSDYLPLVTPGIPPVSIPPVADFSSNTTSGNSPLKVAFTDKSTGSPTAWNWSFGDKTYSTVQNPVHSYSAKGNYAVSLKVTNDAGSNTTIKADYIIVSTPAPTPIPVASFSSNVTSGNKPLTIAFTDTSTNSPTAWSWTFGDGVTSNERNPTHRYSTEGSYTVALTVTNDAGTNTTTKSNYIKVTSPVSPKPVASFSSNVTSGNAPLNVAFTDTSAGSPTTWKWTFGDGTSATIKNPTHKYTNTGTYTVALTATNPAGDNTTTKSNYITVNAPKPPVASFSSSPTSGNAPLSVAFTDTSTNSPTSWSWSFGDGTSATTKNPTHTYTKAGSYTVALTVTNSAGTNTVTKSSSITVKAPIPAAAFSASPTSGNTPLNVVFTDQSTGLPTSWSWNFGDGTSATTKNPTHTYTKAGSYTVTLTATNTAGSNTATKSGYIRVTAPVIPVAAFSGYPTSGTVPLKVQFTDKSTGTPTSWKWTFGDGIYSTTRSPVHTYYSKGRFTVTLTVKNAAGSSYKTISGYIIAT